MLQNIRGLLFKITVNCQIYASFVSEQ